MRKGMASILCFECKLWGPHACMCVMCIEILAHYVMLVRTRIFDIMFVMFAIISCRFFLFYGVRRHVMR